jgi:predicted nucleic acid-binding Zn ribbon protein
MLSTVQHTTAVKHAEDCQLHSGERRHRLAVELLLLLLLLILLLVLLVMPTKAVRSEQHVVHFKRSISYRYNRTYEILHRAQRHPAGWA